MDRQNDWNSVELEPEARTERRSNLDEITGNSGTNQLDPVAALMQLKKFDDMVGNGISTVLMVWSDVLIMAVQEIHIVSNSDSDLGIVILVNFRGYANVNRLVASQISKCITGG